MAHRHRGVSPERTLRTTIWLGDTEFAGEFGVRVVGAQVMQYNVGTISDSVIARMWVSELVRMTNGRLRTNR